MSERTAVEHNQDPLKPALIDLVGHMREQPGRYSSEADMAADLKLSPDQLDAVCLTHYHRSAGSLLLQARVARASSLLIETHEKLPSISQSAGFRESDDLRRCFRDHMGMDPEAFRQLQPGEPFAIELPPEYPAEFALRFQARDSESLCEQFDGTTLRKAIKLDESPVLLELTGGAGRVTVRVGSPGRLSAVQMAKAHEVIRRLLGLTLDPRPFEETVRQDTRLRPLVEQRPGLPIPQTASVFEALTWAIIGQQVNLAFTFKLRRCLVRLTGRPIFDGLYAHPSPGDVARLDYGDLQTVQFSRRKAEYLVDAARRVVSGELPLESFPALDAGTLSERLVSERGIGVWSANYIGMRACGFGDCVPLGDSGLAAGLRRFYALQAKPDAALTVQLMEPFRPYRSFATFHLWQVAGGGA